MLDEKLWVFPWKAGSKSALALADALDVWCLKHEGSKFSGGAGKIILNWGAGTGVFNPKVNGATIWNTPAKVDVAVNKREFFKAMAGEDGPRIPFWFKDLVFAERLLQAGHVLIARDVLESCKGDGIRVVKNKLDIGNSPMYTMKVENTHEFRVYIFNGKVIDSRIKLLARGQEADVDGMRWHEDKYEFCKHEGVELPADVVKQSELCAAKLGLMTVGIDVVFNGDGADLNSPGIATVLEANTAPYLGGDTAEKYAAAIIKYLEAA
jgi:hypothetical protein